VVLAFGVFAIVVFLILGGWLFSVAWGAFAAPVFGLPVIDIGQGVAALTLIWLAGIAFKRVGRKKAT